MKGATELFFAYSVLDSELSYLYNSFNSYPNPGIRLIFYIMQLMFRELIQN